MVLSTFTSLCSHPSPELFSSSQTETLYLLNSKLPIPVLAQALLTSILLYVSMNLTTLDISCKWSQIVFVLFAQTLSRVQLFATLWTVAHQAPRVHGDSPGKNTRVGCHALLLPTQDRTQVSYIAGGLFIYHLSHQGSPHCWLFHLALCCQVHPYYIQHIRISFLYKVG